MGVSTTMHGVCIVARHQRSFPYMKKCRRKTNASVNSSQFKENTVRWVKNDNGGALSLMIVHKVCTSACFSNHLLSILFVVGFSFIEIPGLIRLIDSRWEHRKCRAYIRQQLPFSEALPCDVMNITLAPPRMCVELEHHGNYLIWCFVFRVRLEVAEKKAREIM